jgi:hypothetical protein
VGCGRLVGGGGGWVGTLLGPEASGPDARMSGLRGVCCVVWVSGCVGLCFWSGPPLLRCLLCGGGGGLVGLLFEICIVDASINNAL